jgi:glycine C-acetyltransferase
VAADREIIDYLVQRSRPQLFSNAVPPAVLGGALAALEVLEREPERVARLHAAAAHMRQGLASLGYSVRESPSAILPIIVGPTAKAMAQSERLLAAGVLVVGFGYPVVPEGAARLRVQVSASHAPAHLDRALAAFAAVR